MPNSQGKKRVYRRPKLLRDIADQETVRSSLIDKEEDKNRALTAHGAKTVNPMGYQGSPSAGGTGLTRCS